MRIRSLMAALAAALALLAWHGDEAWGFPGPPGPPPIGLPGPGPGLGPFRPGPPMAPMPPFRPGPSMPPFRPGPLMPPGQPMPPGPVLGPVGGPLPPGGPGGPGGPLPPGGPGGIGGPAPLPGLGGLNALARSGVIAGKYGTVAVSPQSQVIEGYLVRNNFNNYECFRGDWWGRHQGAWRAAAWTTAAAAYTTAAWAACSDYGGYSAEPAYYDYGSNVVYDGDNVYVNGDAVATQEQYAQQATTIADAGKHARATEEEEWLPLGVFSMIQGDQANGNDLFQLAVNKAGVLRGNYYNALSDTTLPVYGYVDKKTQRAAWTVGDRKEPIFEAGIANLTKPQTTMLVHMGKDRTQQWTLVRIDPPAEQK